MLEGGPGGVEGPFDWVESVAEFCELFLVCVDVGEELVSDFENGGFFGPFGAHFYE